VNVKGLAVAPPPEIRTSESIEEELRDVYEKLRLPFGRLEMMTGIRQRRFWRSGMTSAEAASRAGRLVLEQTGFPRDRIGVLIHASVCRDGLEPATAASVHERLGLSSACAIFDLTNACLGVLSSLTQVAFMIESGAIEAGLVVSGELAEPLYNATMRTLKSNKNPTRAWFKRHFASLTIGSSAAAVLLTRIDSSADNVHRFLGGVCRTDSAANSLCRADGSTDSTGDGALMQTDSEGLLHAGCALAKETWTQAKEVLHWTNETPDHIFTHQVGRAHKDLTFQMLELDPVKDFPTVSEWGNTGSAALPGAWALGIDGRPVKKGDKVLLLGIGSGLSCLALGIEW